MTIIVDYVNFVNHEILWIQYNISKYIYRTLIRYEYYLTQKSIITPNLLSLPLTFDELSNQQSP